MGEVGGDPMSPLSSPDCDARPATGVPADPCGVIERPSFSFCDDNGASCEEEIRLFTLAKVLPVVAPTAVADSPLVGMSRGEVDRVDGLFCPRLDRECAQVERGDTLLHPEPMQHRLLGLGLQEDKSQVVGRICATLQLETEAPQISAVEELAPDDENCSSKVPSDAGNGMPACCKPITASRRSNPKRAASLRSSLAEKSTGTKNGASRCSNAADTQALILSRITKRMTGKRNCSRRAAQGRVWGAVEDLVKDFEQNCIAIKLQDKRSKKSSSASGKQRQRHTASRCMSSRVQRTKTVTLANPLYLKDQRFQHPLSCDLDGLHASVPSTLAYFEKTTNTDIGKRGSKVRYNLGGRTCRARTKPLQCGGMHRDNDLESTLTQDTSAVCHRVPFRSGTVALVETIDDNCLLESGTSPDSVIYHTTNDIGSVTSGLTTLPNQVSGRAQCQVGTKSTAQSELHADVSTFAEAFGTHASDSPLDMHMHSNHKQWKKGKKKGNIKECSLPLSEDIINKEEFCGLKNLSEAMKTSNYNIPEWNRQGVITERGPEYIRKTIRNGLNCNNYRVNSSLPGTTELESYENFMEVVTGSENPALSGHDVENANSEVGALGGSLLTDETKAYKVPGVTKEGSHKGRPQISDSARQMTRNSNGRKKGNLCKQHIKGKSKEKNGTHDVCIDASGGMDFSFGIASKANDGGKVVSVGVSVMNPIGDQLPPKESCSVLEGQSLRPRAAWVLCDDCNKWRCIPAELADIIDETDCKWTCKDNKDKAFADCSIPQEKTDDEINAELELQDASGGEYSSHALLNLKAIEPSKPAGSKPASWTSIKSNSFLHRNRRTQTIDEIMICHCKPPLNGNLGCGEHCLNRMLNIECVRGTCPCGDLCSNQQFQKRKYAKFKWFRCGKKGHGLQLQENVSCGQFLIEYVGEVLDFTAYEARQRYYASGGQKHFYFMTLNGGEVIDACTKGNLGRFINHSCNPNCRTEKWMVNGEVCIGLFAIRDIKKGEEVTFDYKFVRVFGAAVKKCFCGAAQCRGYIGSDPSDAEAIVQGDSDEEYPELVDIHRTAERDLVVDMTVSSAIDAKIVKHEEIPIRIGGTGRVLDIDGAVSSSVDAKVVENEEIPRYLIKGERDLDMCEMISDTLVANVVKHEENIIQKEQSNRCASTLPELEDTSCRPLSDGHQLGTSLQSLDSIPTELAMSKNLSDAEVLEDSSHSSNSIQTEVTMCRSISDVQLLVVSPGTSSIPHEFITSSTLGNEKLKANNLEDKLNILKPHSPLKPPCPKVSVKVTPCLKSISPQTYRAKRMPTSSSNRHFEGVHEKLNGLLDGDGGISKSKDATKGYLKLLVLTAADEGFSSQSTRDLSLILDALQKTKSRMVLGDIISKNGLQMLHNILKQNRSNFNRTPIIRKVLKVLQFLAEKEILTPEHIYTSPRRVESFKDTISYLTRHNNSQVNTIARNFRDKLNQWIPPRRVEPLGREDSKLDSQRSYYSWYQSSSPFKCQEQGIRDTAAIVCDGQAVHLLGSSCETDTPGGASILPSQQVSTTVPMTNHSTVSGIRIRKRKTRWDQPSDVTNTDAQSLRTTVDQTVETSSKFVKLASAHLEQTSQLEIMKQISKTHKEDSSSYDDSMQQNTDDEAPPGFGSPCKNNRLQIPPNMFMVADDVDMVDHLQKEDEAPPGFGSHRDDIHPRISSRTSMVAGDVVMSPQKEDEVPPGFGSPRKDTHPSISSETSVVEGDVVMASLQERFLPHLSVSYGMPTDLMQQLGTPEADGDSQCHPGWTVAPGMPFHTFPPLPSYPFQKPNPKPLSPTTSHHNLNRKQIEEMQPTKECCAERAGTSVSAERPEHIETVMRNSQIREQVRWPSRRSDGRFFRTQGRGNQRFDRYRPSRPREGNISLFRGSTRNGTYSSRIGNRKDFNSDGGNQRFDRWQPSWPREGDYSGFRDRTRNGTSGTCIGSTKGFSSDDSCIQEDVCNGDSSTKFRHHSHRK